MGPGSKFTKTHAAVLAIIGSGVAGGGAYVAHQNSREADRAAGGGVVKQDVAVNDRDGNLLMAMQGLTGKDAAAKANDPASKAGDPAKASDVDILKKLENVANDTGIKAEAAEVTEVAQSTEKPYIPEAAKADETSGNVLDGSGSNEFKTSNFVSVVNGSPFYGSNNTDAASDGTEVSSKRGPSVKASKGGIKPEELQKQQAALQPPSGEAIAKAEVKPEAAKERKQGAEGSKTESQKGILSKENKLSENNNGQTDPDATRMAANAAMAPNIDDTLSSMATGRDAAKKRLFSGRPETMPRKTLEGDDDRSVREENTPLRSRCLWRLVSLFAVDGSCDIDKDVPPSERKKAGVTSNDVMFIAASKKIWGQEIKTHCVTISVDAGTDNLVAVLKKIGATPKTDRNPNVQFLLPNGSEFLNETEKIAGVALKTTDLGMFVTFTDGVPASSPEKKPETKTASIKKEIGATKADEDWLQTIWQNAEDDAGGNSSRLSREERQERYERKKDAASKIRNFWKRRKLDKLSVFLASNVGVDIVLDTKQSKVFLEHAQELLTAEFFNDHAGDKIEIKFDNEADTDALEMILEERGLQLSKKDGSCDFVSGFGMPDLHDPYVTSSILYKANASSSEANPLNDVHFVHTLSTEDCPKAVRDMLTSSDGQTDIILDAVCYLGKGGLTDCSMYLEFGNLIPEDVNQWTSWVLDSQNLIEIKNNGKPVQRKDDGISACLGFEIEDAKLEAACAWFVCEYEDGKEEQKEKRRIAVHLFFAEEQPRSIRFKNIGYSFGSRSKWDDEAGQKNADESVNELRDFFIGALVSELGKIEKSGEDNIKRFFPKPDSPWISYFRHGLLDASDLVYAVQDFNDNNSFPDEDIKAVYLYHVNLYKDDDVVYFSENNIEILDGASVCIYDTNREEEFKDAQLQYKRVLLGDTGVDYALLVRKKSLEEEMEPEAEGEEQQQEQQDEEEEEEYEGGEEENHEVDDNDDNEQQGEEGEEGEEQEQEEEEQEDQNQQEVKLTTALLEEPTKKVKQLFAGTDLKDFLDKAREDLVKAGNDPREATIDLAGLCRDDGTLWTKVSVDVLVQYPFWTYKGIELAPNNLREQFNTACNQGRLRKVWYQDLYYADPILKPDTSDCIKVATDEDAKWLAGKGLSRLANAVGRTLQEGKSVKLIDFEGFNLGKKPYLQYFAAYPGVCLCQINPGNFNNTIKMTNKPETWNVDDKFRLIQTENGSFRVQYDKSTVPFYIILSDGGVAFMENLRKTLVNYAGNALNDDMKKVIQSLECSDFLGRPCIIQSNGSLKSSGWYTFETKTSEKHLFDLAHGTADEESMKSWSDFAQELKNFDSEYYKPLILFFLCWDGSSRVDFSTFSKNDFDSWQKDLNITYGQVLENLNVQGIWDKCLKEVENIPNKDKVEEMFGDLKKLSKSDEYVFDPKDIADESEVKKFLESIKDWNRFDESLAKYVTTTTKGGTGPDCDDVACFEIEDWKSYQLWRFELYFLNGRSFPDSKTDPIEACESGFLKDWRKYCTWEGGSALQ